MATRQYIGARYVPKIMGGYDLNSTYEPLSIVVYNNSSYTSKKSVPAGILPTNTEYWALTGNYNAQIEEYRQQVVQTALDLQTETQARIDGDVNTLENSKAYTDSKVENISGFDYKNKTLTIIGDSYTDEETGTAEEWIEPLKQHFKSTGFALYSQSGASTQFWADNISRITNISDVYLIVLGTNDYIQSVKPWTTFANLGTIISKIKSLNTNAIIFLTTPLKLPSNHNLGGVHQIYPVDAYRQCIWNAALINKNCHVISGLKINSPLHDNIHPTSFIDYGVYVYDVMVRGGDTRDFENDFEAISGSDFNLTHFMMNGKFYLWVNQPLANHPLVQTFDSGNIELQFPTMIRQPYSTYGIKDSNENVVNGFALISNDGVTIQMETGVTNYDLSLFVEIPLKGAVIN